MSVRHLHASRLGISVQLEVPLRMHRDEVCAGSVPLLEGRNDIVRHARLAEIHSEKGPMNPWRDCAGGWGVGGVIGWVIRHDVATDKLMHFQKEERQRMNGATTAAYRLSVYLPTLRETSDWVVP